MASRGCAVGWKSESSQLPRLFAELVQIYSERTAMSLEYDAPVAYSAHLVCLKVTEKSYLADRGYTLLGFLPVGIAQPEVEDGGLDVSERVFLHGTTSSDKVFSENFISRKPWRGAQKVHIEMLSEAVYSLSKRLKVVAESAFEVPSESGETRKYFLIILPYCCSISEEKNTSANWRGN